MTNVRYTNIDNFLAYCYRTGLNTYFKLNSAQTVFSGKFLFSDASVANTFIDISTQEVKISFVSLTKEYHQEWIAYFNELIPKLAASLPPDECQDFKIYVHEEENGLPFLYTAFSIKPQPLDMQKLISYVETILENIKNILPIIDIITDGEYITFPVNKAKDIIRFDDVRECLRLVNQAYTYTIEGKYTEAITTATRAIQLNPANSYAYNNRGYAQSMMLKGYSKEAANDYKKAIILNPREKSFYFNAGDIEMCAKNYKNAKKLFQQALTVDPAYEDAKQMIALIEKQM